MYKYNVALNLLYRCRTLLKLSDFLVFNLYRIRLKILSYNFITVIQRFVHA